MNSQLLLLSKKLQGGIFLETSFLRDILRDIFILFFFEGGLAFCKKINFIRLFIIKRKLQHSVDISRFMAPGPLGHYAFLHRINTFAARNRTLLNFKK